MEPQNLTVKEFGKRYGLGLTKTYDLLGSGEIHAIKIGKLTFITRDEAERWFASLPRATFRSKGA